MLALPIATLVALATERQYTYDNNIRRIPDALPTETDRPHKTVTEAQNWLFVGSDRRPGEGGNQRADSIMIVHVPADRRNLFLVSLPRDSYVAIPGHGHNKINAAYAFGGPRLLTATVERLTQVRIDHFAALDFAGFVAMTRAVGGVEVDVAEQVYDPANKVTWPKGKVTLEGERALLFVRQRYGLPGGDFDRIRRQQAFLRALATKVVSKGTLTDPFALNDLLEAMTTSISVDSGVDLATLRELAFELKDLRARQLVSATVPLEGTDMVRGMSIVRLDSTGAARLFASIRNDTMKVTGTPDDQVR
ncbi:LCP family protein [Nonomuraea soli]|uniref:LCP family protein required for cell wall assembly n=1 Tax=Nonomuraea soli TaxID=1032476 RepID=A0A7W0CVG5_9ACTN|nr:LCP family protein [Nonomuraea soli]MBA2897972.1 LCP family protein required for cell wall assembly [Nonomuraea soli]